MEANGVVYLRYYPETLLKGLRKTMQTLYETTGSLKPTIFRQAIPVLISLK
jgi:hypothetical protein